MVSATTVMVEIVLSVKRTEAENVRLARVMCFDRESQSYTSLPEEFSGPMAISWDGSRMIRCDLSSGSIREFTLK